MKNILVSLIVLFIRLLIRLPDGLLAGLFSLLHSLVPEGDLKDLMKDITTIFRSGKPNTNIVRDMMTKSQQSELKMMVKGALFSVDKIDLQR